jgi:hypothetical protein
MSRSSFIQTEAPSKRSVVFAEQALHLADLIDFLEKQTTEHFRVASLSSCPPDGHNGFWELEAYKLFLHGAYACGFVMKDGKPENPLEDVQGDTAELVQEADFPTLRQVVHFLVRAERWADGYSSPILQAMITGLLPAIGRRLRNDETLYDRS